MACIWLCIVAPVRVDVWYYYAIVGNILMFFGRAVYGLERASTMVLPRVSKRKQTQCIFLTEAGVVAKIRLLVLSARGSRSARADLLALATLMEDLKGTASGGGSQGGMQFFSILNRDCGRILEAVIQPSMYLDLWEAFILEILSTYAIHKCDPSKHSLSFLQQRKPYLYSLWRRLQFLDPFKIELTILMNNLWGSAKVIHAVAVRKLMCFWQIR
ncbi:hypothetical protein BCR34DRAFT_592214 [Clohesyomyces aquaticus]|uniref:Uncharacterized protein n=1 Tax=Clohesyomyces aquaticus TaxID=1231657 RepID=A0A1Y1YUD0_9PLEO|nr:hypothetical protein BCR34DRAFT_592214 [Clohesyomyces aquaticus]